jgi:MFS family permease
MTAFMVSMMIASMLGGRLAEVIGVSMTCMAGSLTAMAGLAWLSLLAPDKNPLHIVGGLVLAGSGLGLANGPSQSAALASVERTMSGIASGVISTCRYLGGVIGISILTLLLSAPASAQSLAQYHLALMIFAGSFFVAALVALLLPAHPRHV